MGYLSGVGAQLAAIAKADRLRRVRERVGSVVADFSTNDYLGLSGHPTVAAALASARCGGSGGSRLLGGSHPEHAELEERLAAWVGRERALLFSSGYLAALGVIPVLAAFADVAYSDALNHACLIDGLRLARLPRQIYPHRQLPPARTPGCRALIVTESVFGMDGDIADLAAILAGLGPDDIVLVDEAHALGVAGKAGAGLAAELQDDRIIILGTLSKALGALGGFVAGPSAVVELLVNTARSFIFDTALPPAVAAAATAALGIAQREDGRRTKLHSLVRRLVDGLARGGFEVSATYPSPIVPVPAGSEAAALALAARCATAGFVAPAIRPPTVPPGSSRLRLSVSADQTEAHIDGLLRVLGA